MGGGEGNSKLLRITYHLSWGVGEGGVMFGFFGCVKGKLNFSFFPRRIAMGEKEEEIIIIIIIIGFGKKEEGVGLNFQT